MSDYKFRQDDSHYNGGEVFFGYGYLAVDEPRLKMVRHWYRQCDKRGKTEDHFFVDGAPVASLLIAAELLKVPAVFTAEEIAALRQIGDEPADMRKIIDWKIRLSLDSKGAIAWGPPGHFARTDAGRAAIAEHKEQ